MSESEKIQRNWLSLKKATILFAFAFFIWLFSYAYSKIDIVHLDQRFEPKAGFPVGYRERYFALNFPTFSDIEQYLHDATILISHPPNGNGVYYFDKDRKFYSWTKAGFAGGEWWISPKRRILVLGDKWRVTKVYSFCMLFSDMPAEAQQDNCYLISQLASIVTRGRGTKRDYTKGDVFNLSSDRSPGQLPSTDISIASLLATKTDSPKN